MTESNITGAKPPSIVCCSASGDRNWRWFAPVIGEDRLNWEFYYQESRSIWERKLMRPNLALIRACWQSVLACRRLSADLLVSHNPHATFWCEFFASLLGVEVEHIAWSFNFASLPRGAKHWRMRRYFRDVAKFIVYSRMERTAYSEHFNIPIDKINVLLWGVQAPTVTPAETPIEHGDYVCAIGGNARDYETLMAAMTLLPDLPLVAVMRPYNQAGLAIPANVRVRVNVPLGETNNILKYSRFMVLPLTGSEVPCGLVSLVAAMHLAKTSVVTNSTGVSDYVKDGHNAVACEANSPEQLADAIKRLWENGDLCRELGANAKSFAAEHCSEPPVLNHFIQLLQQRDLLR